MDKEYCEKCLYLTRLKHNFKQGEGFENSFCCLALLDYPGSNGWVQEVTTQDRCELFTKKC